MHLRSGRAKYERSVRRGRLPRAGLGARRRPQAARVGARLSLRAPRRPARAPHPAHTRPRAAQGEEVRLVTNIVVQMVNTSILQCEADCNFVSCLEYALCH